MSELAVRVVCARGDWHKNGKPRVLATFVRDDNQVTADYWENGCGWRAERPSSIDPYRDQEASLQKRAGAFRESSQGYVLEDRKNAQQVAIALRRN